MNPRERNHVLRVTLPYPPSTNVLWKMFRGRMMLSVEARRYKQGAHMRALTAGFRPLSGNVIVSLGVYRPRESGDLDNRIKVTLDALNGVAWNDDAQIVEIHARRYDDKANPRIEVVVERTK